MNNIDKKIGYILQKYREDNNFSQQLVADKLGKSKSTVCLWESGKRSINMSDFLRIVEVMGYDKNRISKDLIEVVYANIQKK